jgi:hypothetical protein
MVFEGSGSLSRINDGARRVHFFRASYMPQSGQTITHCTTTATKTTLAIKTAGLGYSSLPAKMILLLVETMPDYQNVETYHIGAPKSPESTYTGLPSSGNLGKTTRILLSSTRRRIVDLFSDPTASYR